MATVSKAPRTITTTLASTTAGPFDLGYRIFDDDAVSVYIDGVETEDFTLSATYEDGFTDAASVTLGTAQDSGTVIVIDADLNPARADDYIDGPGLTALLNNELARSWSAIADIKRDTGRSLRLLSTTAPIVPPASASGFLSVDSAGDVTIQTYNLNTSDFVFATRAAFVPWWAANSASVADGTVLPAGGFSYIADSAAMGITDLPGLKPFGTPTPQHFGAVGDGATDDRDAFVALFASGKRGHIPSVSAYYRLSTLVGISTDGFVLTGEGTTSKIVIDDMTTAVNVFSVTGDNVKISGIHIVPTCSTRQSTFANYAIILVGCTGSEVRDVEVSGHRQGIYLDGTTRCIVSDCYFHDSVVDSALDTNTNTGSDVRIGGDTSHNIISENRIYKSCGVGVFIQTTSTKNTANFNKIIDNTMDDIPQYGISIYDLDGNAGGSGDEIYNTIISGNTISNVQGDIENPSGDMPFGAGIYVQSCPYTLVSGNSIYNTNISTDKEQLGIAAISVTNCEEVTITGNDIRDPQWYGISIVNSNDFGTLDVGATVTGNIINGAVKDAIYVKAFDFATITGNTVNGGTLRGIYAWDGGVGKVMRGITVTGNTVLNVGTTGILLSDCAKMTVTGNVVMDCTQSGISISDGIPLIGLNQVENNALRGIEISAAVTNGIVSNNVVTGNGHNFNLAAPVRFVDNIYGSAVTADFQGAFGAIWRVFTASDTTPSVKAGKTFETNNGSPTSITTFDDGYEGQEIIVTANDANTTLVHGAGTMILNGNSNFAMNTLDCIHLIKRGGRWIETGRQN